MWCRARLDNRVISMRRSKKRGEDSDCSVSQATGSALDFQKISIFANTFADMRTYPSKLLLFGEHILLIGSPALALPMYAYGGKWVENSLQVPDELRKRLFQFAESEQLAKIAGLNVPLFLHELQNGLVFESSIPIGYGLGSSGALCAAVYDRYCAPKTQDLVQLKTIFAQMESFFHGSSSGIDPLTSYVEQALLIRHKTNVSIAKLMPWKQAPVIFLIDSTLPRNTGALVHWFLERYTQAVFRQKLEKEYLPIHAALLQSFLLGDANNFWPNLQQISKFQLEHFEAMIPATLRELWINNLDNQQITLKICGAGGGGFMLGFSKTIEPVHALAKTHHIVFPFRDFS